MTRRARFFTALAAAAAILFAQLAVSVYACPMEAPSATAAPDGCAEWMASANLCRVHCDYGHASFEAAKPLHAPHVALVAGLRITLPDVAIAWLPAPAPSVAPGPSPPPPRWRFTVLRI